MIIIKLQGGLGNQLFQYAIARYFAIKNNAQVKLDISWYQTQTFRKYELDNLNITGDIAVLNEINKFKKYQYKNGGGIFRYLYNTFIANEKKYIREKSFVFSKSILEVKDNAYLDGIWFSEKYFSSVSDTIRREITLKIPLHTNLDQIRQIMRDTESVSICIRRTDFTNNPKVSAIHGLLPMEYYDMAIEKIKEKLINPNFFIFSDDIEWAKQNFKIKYPTYFVSDPNTLDACQQLMLMSECKHNISANSSFSWWGAWLCTNPNKIIIVPKKWFKEESRNTDDLIPESWIKLPNTLQ